MTIHMIDADQARRLARRRMTSSTAAMLPFGCTCSTRSRASTATPEEWNAWHARVTGGAVSDLAMTGLQVGQ